MICPKGKEVAIIPGRGRNRSTSAQIQADGPWPPQIGTAGDGRFRTEVCEGRVTRHARSARKGKFQVADRPGRCNNQVRRDFD